MKRGKIDPTPRILREVHESVTEMYKAGFIDAKRMRHFDALCLAKVPRYTASRIRALRARHQLSQAVLASLLNASLSTVRQWEIGAKPPAGPSAKLLDLLDRKGLEVLI